MEITLVLAIKVFISATTIAGLLDLYIVQVLKGHSGRFASATFISQNPSWISRFRLMRYLMDDTTIKFMETRTILFPGFELTFGTLVLISLYIHGLGGTFIRDMIFLALGLPLAIISWQDPENSVAPDIITIPGTIIGVLTSLTLSPIGLIGSVLGGAVGLTLFYVIALLSRGGVGGGVIKTAMMIGAFCGYQGVLIAIFSGAFIGSVAGICLIMFKGMSRNQQIAFVPFLIIGGIIAILWTPHIVSWYKVK